MMKVLVTGASGFLGRHLCEELVKRDYFVVGLVRDAVKIDRRDERRVDAIVVGSFEQVERTIAEYEIDTVFHLAAQTQVSTAVKHPIGTFDDNVRGTVQVLEACRRQQVKRVVVASSDKAYGSGPSPYVEDQPLKADGIYATSKMCADAIAQAYIHEYKMPIAITRCGNLYGPWHLNWSTLIPGTIRSLVQGERPILRSNGSPERDYLFIDDIVEGYIKLAESDALGAFNFGTGKGHTVLDVVEHILRLTRCSDLRPMIDLGTNVEILSQRLDASRARAELGWAPKHDLDSGLRVTIAWYQHFLRGGE